ncbi:MAG: hypothetical protein H6970_00865 [Gammaproteobacteria bacterium]|nr:hypothetical protein [Gammaproteobacteria bacterium]MCP5423608.1 hypothetical protein [Gammaproteobacteria bacterium]
MRYFLLLSLALLGCSPNGNEVTVSVVNASHQTLTDIRVISGGDKFYLKDIQAGADHKMTLRPGQASDYQVTFFYSMHDHQTVWESDSLPAGKDYLLEARVADDGGVHARHCPLPCQLP